MTVIITHPSQTVSHPGLFTVDDYNKFSESVKSRFRPDLVIRTKGSVPGRKVDHVVTELS